MLSILDFVKLVGAAAAGMVFMGGLYSGWIGLIGGRLIPWLSEKEIQTMINTSTQDLRDEANAQTCQDYMDRLARARMALQRNAEDMTAKDLQFVSLQKILTIPGCRL